MSVTPPDHRPPRANVLGVGISLITLDSALGYFKDWLREGKRGYVCIRDAHGVVLARREPDFRALHNEAGMVTPDGMPIVWFCRALGHCGIDRVYGPDLMQAVLKDPELRLRRHFLLGGAPGVAEELARRLTETYPGFAPVGIYAPPPDDTSAGLDRNSLDRLNDSNAEFVWVGLGSPKQERYMARHFPHCRATVMIGVGAAFDFLSGRKAQAPRWLQRSGFEWLFRLASEPRRLAGRYWRTVPPFILLTLLAATGLRNFPLDE